MNKVRWSVVVPEETDRALRSYLASQAGMKKGAISDFVDEAVRAYLFDLVTGKVKERCNQNDLDDLLTAIKKIK